jgi:hypothetical protein
VDEDDGWECLRVMPGGYYEPFTLFDNDGTPLLSDTGNAFYSFDGKEL